MNAELLLNRLKNLHLCFVTHMAISRSLTRSILSRKSSGGGVFDLFRRDLSRDRDLDRSQNPLPRA